MSRTSKAGKDERSADVEREIVRMLWVVHFATTDQLCRLVWSDGARTSRDRLVMPLRRLYEMHMIWREPRRTAPGYRNHANGRAAGGWYYGLTDRGRDWAADVMPELTPLRCTTREGYMHDPDRRTITHSAHHTEFCTRIIERLRGDADTVAMFFETESTVLGNHLRMDGLIRLRLRRESSSSRGRNDALPPWHVPWLPTLRAPVVDGTFDATFAIEIDEGTESLSILEAKAQNYRRTFMHGMLAMQRTRVTGSAYDLPVEPWYQVLCPPEIVEPTDAVAYFPIPVVVMNSETRLANVWCAWNRGWPGSEVRMTTWEHLGRARSLMSARYLNQDEQWVDLLGTVHDER
jgi:hypothetical protein